LRAILIALVVVVVLLGVLLILYGSSSLLGSTVWNSLPSKTVWKLLNLLALPITLGVAVPLLNWLQKKRELDVEHQRAQDEALQAYPGSMSELTIDHHLRASKLGEDARAAARPPDQNVEHPDEDVRALARARTLTALTRLDGERKRSVLQFLYESGPVTKDHLVVDLWGADMSKANLRGATLSNADLRGADLKDADLRIRLVPILFTTSSRPLWAKLRSASALAQPFPSCPHSPTNIYIYLPIW
jgi:Pentapeptide repeats (8 copies)